MDPPLALPAFLRARPRTGEHAGPPRARVVDFDPLRASAPGCPDFLGLALFPAFLSESEARALLAEIERAPFRPAQSGKLKQHYGAKVNFNKRKLNASAFMGLPGYAGWIEHRLRQGIASLAIAPARRSDSRLREALERYRTMDAFVLRYHEHDQSNLDLHVDDPFAYGEAILDLSLESDSVMTFVRERRGGEGGRSWDCVRVALPARSLAVLHGPARFEWEHGVLAYDIRGRRTSITLRTLSEELQRTDEGHQVARAAEQSLREGGFQARLGA